MAVLTLIQKMPVLPSAELICSSGMLIRAMLFRYYACVWWRMSSKVHIIPLLAKRRGWMRHFDDKVGVVDDHKGIVAGVRLGRRGG